MQKPKELRLLALNDASRPDQKEMLSYWRGLPQALNLPRFQNFDFLEISRIVPSVLTLQKSTGSDHIDQINYFGSQLVDYVEFDMTGMRIADALPDADHLAFVKEVIFQMESGKEPAFWSETLYWQNREWVKFEILGLPFEDAEADVDRMVLLFNFVHNTDPA